ncbi:MAG: ABC transporter permease [Desulfobacterales bacterium]|nr:MAG: ABC transporter permease [Desulfobacterales bacterium]
MDLWRYILRRILFTIPTVFGALVIMFIVTRILPGDPVMMLLGPAHASPENIESMRKLMGLDHSVPAQFVIYLKQLLHGDLGYSYHTGNPVSYELLTRFPATFELTTFAFILMVCVSLPLGVVSGYFRNKSPDNIISVFTVIGVSMPTFWLGLLLIYTFFYKLGIAPPPMGRLSPEFDFPAQVTGLLVVDTFIAGDFEAFFSALQQLILPGITLAFFNLAIIVRTLKADMIETLEEDYIRTAKAMGFGIRRVLIRHAFRNALLPTVTMIGAIYGALLGGAVLTEVVFSWPGMGLYAVESIQYLNYAGLQGFIIFYVIIFAIVNLLVDISYRWIDPRIRLD